MKYTIEYDTALKYIENPNFNEDECVAFRKEGGMIEVWSKNIPDIILIDEKYGYNFQNPFPPYPRPNKYFYLDKKQAQKLVDYLNKFIKNNPK